MGKAAHIFGHDTKRAVRNTALIAEILGHFDNLKNTGGYMPLDEMLPNDMKYILIYHQQGEIGNNPLDLPWTKMRNEDHTPKDARILHEALLMHALARADTATTSEPQISIILHETLLRRITMRAIAAPSGMTIDLSSHVPR